MNKSFRLINSVLILSLAMLACGVSITFDSTDEPEPTAKSTTKPRPTSTKQPTLTEETTHQLYAGFTGESNIPFLILHPSGDKLGITEDTNSSTMAGVIYSSSDGKSVAVYTDSQGLPKSAVAGEEILLYSNYTDTTVDVTIVHSDGGRDAVRVKLDTDMLNKITTLNVSSNNLVSYSRTNSFTPQHQNVLGYIKEGLFALDIATCVGEAAKFALTPAALLALVTACDGPILEEVIRERKASNLDVGGLETLSQVLDVLGCASLQIRDCVSVIVTDMENLQEIADEKNSNIPPEPTKKKKYN